MIIIFVILLTDKLLFHEDYDQHKKDRIIQKKMLEEIDSFSKPTYSFDTVK